MSTMASQSRPALDPAGLDAHGAVAPAGALRAAWLLTRLRWRRLTNQLATAYRFGKKKDPAARRGTARKSRAGWLLTGFVVICMFGNVLNLSYQSLTHMEKGLGTVEIKKTPRGWLGIQMGQVTEEVAQRLGIRPAHGVLVTGTIAGSAARTGGLLAGDVILQIDGREIKDYAELSRIIAGLAPGKTIELLIVRGGKLQRLGIQVETNPSDRNPAFRRAPPAPGSVLASGVLNGVTLEVSLLLLAAVFITIASREISRPEWDLEWLVTVPLPLSTLLGARLAERTVTNAAGLLTLGPFLTVLALHCGYRWSAPLIGIGAMLGLLLIVATVQTVVDTGLRLWLPTGSLKNLQALISVFGVLPLFLAMPMAMHDSGFMFDIAATLPGWLNWLPPALVARAIAAADAGSAAHWIALALAEILAVVAIGYALLYRQLRYGVAAGGEGIARVPRTAPRAPVPASATRSALSVVQRRELLLLRRDRTFMAQTLVFPVVMVGAQVFINAGGNLLGRAITHPETLATIAFGLGAYTLMASAMQTLNAEGRALWILYCVPRPLEFVLWQKAKLWAAVATLYAAVVFAVAIGLAGHVTPQFAASAAIVLAGVPIFAVIATALGVFACDPLAEEVQRRVRVAYVYLYMVLASLYAYAVYATTLWQRGALMILSALLAAALWQKARDQFDYLLDPSASPPARVSVADGMMAALLFFVLQGLVLGFFIGIKAAISPAAMLWISFCTAGAVTYAAVRFIYWRAGTQGVPRIVGANLRGALPWGVAGGVAAALGGIAYIVVASSLGVLPRAPHPSLAAALWLAPLAILAAPLFEEFIFRGLIFGGLRRTLGPIAATLASAGIFAIVHPPGSFIPVFGMAVCAAFVYERTRMLAAPMLVHAIYNAVVLGFQWGIMQ